MNAPNTEKFWNLPNALSLYRLCSFPLLAYFVLSHRESLFIGFLIFNLATDILDGLIARTFNLKTKIGAQLDSTADLGSYILAIWGICVFRWDALEQNIWPFYGFIAFKITSQLFGILKFRRIVGFHLYSAKILGYIQGSFIAVCFLFQFYPGYYLFAMYCGCLVCTEEILVMYFLTEPRQNAKGLYWVLKSLKK